MYANSEIQLFQFMIQVILKSTEIVRKNNYNRLHVQGQVHHRGSPLSYFLIVRKSSIKQITNYKQRQCSDQNKQKSIKSCYASWELYICKHRTVKELLSNRHKCSIRPFRKIEIKSRLTLYSQQIKLSLLGLQYAENNC